MKQYKYKINGNDYNVVVNDPEENIAIVEVNGTSYHVEMEPKPKPVKPVVRSVQSTPRPAPANVTPKPVSLGKNGVQSPLPGVILELKVAVGDAVKKGQQIGQVAKPTKYGSAIGTHLEFKVCQGEFAIDPKVALGE